MKKIIVASVFLFVNAMVYAQAGTGMWTWMNGDTTLTAVYGTKGIPDPANHPSYYKNGGFWKGKDGKFWLFGLGNLTDTWSYDPVANQFAWESGTHVNSATYGTMGIPAASNCPPLTFAPVSWTDTTGNLWLFGGHEASFGPRNMLWKFDVTTKQWTWIRGSASPWDVGTYGTKGITNPLNNPPSRNSSSGWVDNNNNLWLCLGEFSVSTGTFLNDVWKYNIATNEWTWMAGEYLGSGITPVNDIYDSIGTFSPTNTPAGKESYNALSDNSGNGYLLMDNDFWKYNITLNQWACIRDDSSHVLGMGDFFCVPAQEHFPNAVYNNTLCAKDHCGNFWYREDSRLWQYNVSADKFTEVNAISGSHAVYGIMGIPASSNSPFVSRGGAAWIDNNGDFWEFAGTDFNPASFYSAMWKYDVDTNCVSCTVNQNVFANIGVGLNGQCVPAAVTFTNLSVNALTYYWNFGDGTTSTSINPIHTYTTSGFYDVTLIAYNGTHSDTTIYYGIEIYDSPVASFTTDFTSGTPILTVTTTNTSTTGSSMAYWWNFGAGDPSEYAINNMYSYTTPGVYNLSLYVYDNATGCSDSAITTITVYPLGTFESELTSENDIVIFPKPAKDKFNIVCNNKIKTLGLFDITGRQIFMYNAGNLENKMEINVSNFQAGVYFITVELENGELKKEKLVITK